MEKDIFLWPKWCSHFWRRDLIEKLTSSSDFLLIFKLKERAIKMNFPIWPERHTSAFKLSFKRCQSWFLRRTSLLNLRIERLALIALAELKSSRYHVKINCWLHDMSISVNHQLLHKSFVLLCAARIFLQLFLKLYCFITGKELIDLVK